MKILSKVPISKGWSKDKKYCIVAEDGNKYLLRVSHISRYDVKKREFEMMREAYSLGIPMCRGVEFGICHEGVYSVQGWIDGVDLKDSLAELPLEKQYDYGVRAGKILKRLHSIPAPENTEDWEKRFNLKIDKKIKSYMECPLKYERGQFFIDLINESRSLLKNRPQTFQHGDYHRGNMMLEGERLYIIDFDRYDFGDPLEDNKAIAWDVSLSPEFAKGRIDGYFNGCVSHDFWKLLALYVSLGVISSLPWAIPFGDYEIETMKEQAEKIFSWYDGESYVPKWYKTIYKKGIL